MQIKLSELSKKLLHQPAMPLSPELYELLHHKKVVKKGGHKVKLNGVLKYIDLKETLIKTGDNQWHVVGEVIGTGGFGTVYKSSLKIILRNGGAWLEPADDVVKSVSLGWEPDKTFQEIVAEANFQKGHRVAMHAVVRDDNQAYIVTENCGVTLAELLAKTGLSFDFRLQLLLAVANELLLLEQTGVVHRDLKPNNICIKYTSQGIRVTLIDFGLAHRIERPNYEDWGTLSYLSPETFCKRASTHASDRWAFAAIAGEILGCDNAELFKDAFLLNGPYRYSTLLKNTKIPSDVDPILIKDLKVLLQNQCSTNPKNRESLDFIIKFLLLIPTRRAIYGEFIQKRQALEKELQALKKECRSLNITNEVWNAESILKGTVNFDHPNPFIKYQLNKLKNDVSNAIKELKPLGSHLLETKRLLLKNLSSREYRSVVTNLSLVTKNITSFTEYLKTVPKYSPMLAESLNVQRLVGGNSSGAQEIKAIIESNKPSLEKLMLLKELGRAKTKSNLSNWYSRSHFFGNGRHAGMETLYSKLAELSPEPDRLAGQLNEIGEYTKLQDFSHITNTK